MIVLAGVLVWVIRSECGVAVGQAFPPDDRSHLSRIVSLERLTYAE